MYKAKEEVPKLKFSDTVNMKFFHIETPSHFVASQNEIETKMTAKDFQWYPEEIEVMETAVSAFRYFPKAVVKRVHKELKEMNIGDRRCSKLQVCNWLKEASEEDNDEEEIEVKIRNKLLELRNNDDQANVNQDPLKISKVTFSNRLGIKVYDRDSPATELVESVSSYRIC